MPARKLAESSALIGRDRECAVLRNALSQVRRGSGRTVFLVGEDGVGKSRLALEAAGWGRSADMRVLLGRASSIGPVVALRPLAEALAHLFRDQPTLDHESLAPYRPALGRIIPEYHVESVTTIGAPSSPVLLAEAVLRLLSLSDTGGGCLLILEDLHDADPQTFAVVEYLADNLVGQATLLLATLRHEPGPAWDLAHALTRRHSGIFLRLERLDREAIRQLAAATLSCPAESIPDEALAGLWRDSAGNPFLAEALLDDMVNRGVLVMNPTGCRLTGEVRTKVPTAVGRSVVKRVDRLGPAGWHMLSAAAVIGERFPISVIGRALGMDDSDLLGHLRSAVSAELLRADAAGHDWYVFRDSMTAVALLGQLTPADQAVLAQRAVEAVRDLYPQLPGEWCPFAARLTHIAGDLPRAAQLFAVAGRRTLAAGRPRLAVDLLEQAWQLLDPSTEPGLRAEILHDLVSTLIDCGEVERGLDLLDSLDDLCDPAVVPERTAALHVQFARLAQLGGRTADAAAQIEAARTILGPDAPEHQTAPVDAVAAQLLIDSPESNVSAPDSSAPDSAESNSPQRVSLDRVEQLAVYAVEKAERAGLPAVACQGWQVRGVLARRRGADQARSCFRQMWKLAERNQLPLWRMRATALLAEEEWLWSGDATALVRSGERARHVGAQGLRHEVNTRLALNHVLHAEYAVAERLVDECATEAYRLGLAESGPYLTMVRAVCAAHRGRRNELDEVLAEFRRCGGERSSLSSLIRGMASAVCALLEEDPGRARDDLVEAAQRDVQRPAPYPLAGQHGLQLLLEVLRGKAGWQRYRAVSSDGASRLHWNRQFVLLSRAVLLGRRGQSEKAEATVTAARQTSFPHPVAIHLGLRLVAEAAYVDRWGDPVGWLRLAEEYFRQVGVTAVARACRVRLRRLGVVVPYRRDASRVPPALRLLGVTEREYEVFQLLADWSDNRGIADQLFISPRTVEKHVASLILKTGQTNRVALSRYAATVRE